MAETRGRAPQDLVETLLAVGVEVETLVTCDVEGLEPPTLADDPEAKQAIEHLPALVLDNDGDGAPITPQDQVLGEGGMGIVSSAHQAHLNREVAIKTVRDQQSGAALMLFKESQVLGGLEHPNIVPVHMLGADAFSQPMLVMKRLEGDAWTEYMPGERSDLSAPADQDPLEWNLRVLMQVCNAVQYAHSRGVVHRDIKPGNVMVGAFGEVYLLDWGLAASLTGERAFGLAETLEIRHVAGTPGYMAPEMAAADGANIDERTDVYLLGGCLHTILTGTPRHRGSSAMDRLLRAYASPPFDYDRDVPTELAGICNRAMAERREDRYQSAQALRDALTDFLHHRSSIALAREAADLVATFCRAVEVADETQESGVHIHALFGECHFGLRQALRQWEHNVEAQEAQQRLLEARIDYELRLGSVEAAELLRVDLPRANPGLDERIAQRRAEAEDEAERLRMLQRMWSLDLGMGGRSRVMLGMGTLWGLVYLVLGLLARHDVFRAEYVTFITISVVHGATLGALDMWVRRNLPRTEVNRRFMQTLWVSAVGPLLVLVFCRYHDLPFTTALGLVVGTYAMVSCIAAIAIDLRMFGTAASFALGFVVIAVVPEWCYWATGAAAFCGLWVASRYWRPTEDPPRPVSLSGSDTSTRPGS